ncbi:helix-turn-helix transcriptional regulator [Sulfitobacter geojensis]|uniref:Autoinducer binding domain-containing protein n=1 Tax=Sulfitobacter geojensis TaxID=1342299 RepID=A0AAE2W1B1_9RHOB|nr:LuxR family transcriptional regulator [Sulfitobacter geojensis]MBM1690648.1 autoinducer binding domain-containing protein [Sulfitobacter geojensis]MBM1694714.1 autoinducer binding domain-containing protein [Sulfitobacter geojensis]MBM1707580.1 autoinducer binding domain-containing protein [Sulfitobacter geojensis]MBM1711190.1 autoinducer binding domain-containing protein [Sulfitobacter geojensis]MBM1715705.1 autoinducer binding domain-containing protein [Sulfitobacter geojensis]
MRGSVLNWRFDLVRQKMFFLNDPVTHNLTQQVIRSFGGGELLVSSLREIEAAQTADDVWQLAVAALDAVGADFVTYITIAADYSSPFLRTVTPQLYAHYDVANDPFLQHCCASYDITCTGVEYLADYPYLPKEAKGFIKQAAEIGFRSGLGIPVRLVGGLRFGGMNIGTRLARPEFEATVLPRAEEFRLFALVLHRRLEELEQPTSNICPVMAVPPVPALSELSPREREIVWLISKGLSRKEIARSCKLSPHTVADYTQAAYRKLSVRNRVEVARLVMGL